MAQNEHVAITVCGSPADFIVVDSFLMSQCPPSSTDDHHYALFHGKSMALGRYARSTCTTIFVGAALYIFASLLALAGIALTTSTYYRDKRDGKVNFETRLVIRPAPAPQITRRLGVRGGRC
ncbi:hypothetical protein [Mycobacterium parmense]|uniref:hypothetical protein n=1 Tax=Mycobacterium parmense TaxID=185642 RepID=UPI0013D6858A|nr:hypothetical protein [Mycobacterium parmense]MCV7349408.1 hypothetical protein [Mycobacterium parmense]